LNTVNFPDTRDRHSDRSRRLQPGTRP